MSVFRRSSVQLCGLLASILCVTNAARAEVTSHAATKLHWYRGNTHTHTSAPPNSDANETPDFVANWYRDHGYQFIVITDHEHLTDVGPLNERFAREGGRFLVLAGQEVTQIVADARHLDGVRHAHVNGISTKRLVMPIRPARAVMKDFTPQQRLQALAANNVTMEQAYQRNLAAIRDAGGIPQVNHPNLQWSVQLEDLIGLPEPFLLEIWNGYPTSNNLGGTNDSGQRAPSAEGLWDALLSRGKVVWGVGSDDSHTYHEFDSPNAPNPGRAWVMVRAPELTVGAIVGALADGQFYASTGVELESYQVDAKAIEITMKPLPDWSPVLTPSTRYHTRFMGDGGRVLAEVKGTRARYVFRRNDRYVRASIVDSDGRRAWTQPVFLGDAK